MFYQFSILYQHVSYRFIHLILNFDNDQLMLLGRPMIACTSQWSLNVIRQAHDTNTSYEELDKDTGYGYDVINMQ